MEYNGKTYKTGQGNNAYVFPGIALGVITTGMYHVVEDLFIVAAQTVADNVTEEVITSGSVYPLLSDIKEVSMQIATRICQYAYDKGNTSYISVIWLLSEIIHETVKGYSFKLIF